MNIEEMKKECEYHKLMEEILLWKIFIIEHPEQDKEPYEDAIKENELKLKKLKEGRQLK